MRQGGMRKSVFLHTKARKSFLAQKVTPGVRALAWLSGRSMQLWILGGDSESYIG